MEPSVRFKILEKVAKENQNAPKAPDRFAQFEIRANPAKINPTAVTMAFEDNAIPKFLRLIAQPSVETKLATLHLLYNYTSKHENIIKLIHAEGITPLIGLLSEEEPIVRQRSAAVIARIAAIYAGRAAIFSHPNAFSVLLGATSDDDAEVRQAVHVAICNMCSGIQVGDAVAKGCIPVLVSCVSRDVDSIKVLALDTLYYCTERIEVALLQCLAEGLVPILVTLLALDHPEVVEKAGSLLSAITVHPEGKKAAVSCGSIPKLVDLLGSDQPDVLTTCSEALMNATTIEEGFTEAVRAGACPRMLALLEAAELPLTVRVNVVKLVSNLAVHADGRAQLRECAKILPLLVAGEPDEDEVPEQVRLRESVQEALRLLGGSEAERPG